MFNHRNSSEETPSSAKRKRGLAVLAQQMVSSDDDDNVSEGMAICNIIENQIDQRSQSGTSRALHALGETIRKTLLEINDIREQNRERRHRELLQILRKMAQQENPAKNESVESDKANNEHNNSLSEFVEQNYLQNIHSNSIRNNDCNGNPKNNVIKSGLSNQHYVDSTSVTQTSTTSTTNNLLPKSEVTNKLQASKIKNVIAVKHSDNKKEFTKMRAQMLELQREKMEDRERKKLELLRMQNMTKLPHQYQVTSIQSLKLFHGHRHSIQNAIISARLVEMQIIVYGSSLN